MDYSKLKEKMIEKTKEDVKKELLRRDRVIVHAVKTMDAIDKTGNLLAEKLQEWYSVYNPELKAGDSERLFKAIENLERKENSMGADLTKEDLNQIRSYSERVKALYDEREKISKYLEKIMKEEAPNITAILGSTLGARFIATAGSLEKLAEFPSSTVQVLGAEKALFAHLKKGVNPPKYGLLFQYPLVRKADKKNKGKIARKTASKVSIAAKVDFFKGQFIGDKLLKELEQEAEKLSNKKKEN